MRKWLLSLTLAALLAGGAAGEAPPAGPPVAWRARSWSGTLWDKDVSAELRIEPQPDGGWLIENRHPDYSHSYAILSSLDIRKGPVEMALRTTRGLCRVGVCSESGRDANWCATLRESDTDLVVRFGLVRGRPVCVVNGLYAPVERFARASDVYRPFIALGPAVRVEVRSVQQLPADAAIVAEMVGRLPAAAPAPASWRTRVWNGSAWTRETTGPLTFARQRDQSWRVQHAGGEDSRAVAMLENLDARKGAVEMDVRVETAGCRVGLLSASGRDAHVTVPIDETDAWVRVRLGIADGQPTAWTDERPEKPERSGEAPDVYRPFIVLPPGSTIQVRSVGQVRAPAAPQAKP